MHIGLLMYFVSPVSLYQGLLMYSLSVSARLYLYQGVLMYTVAPCKNIKVYKCILYPPVFIPRFINVFCIPLYL